MRIRIDMISKSPLLMEFTKEIFEGNYGFNFNIEKKNVIDTDMVPRVSPDKFQESMNRNSNVKVVSSEEITHYIQGRPRQINGIQKIKPLLNDPSVNKIECQGAGSPLVLVRRGVRQFTRIVLNKDEIKDILDDFTNTAHVPLIEGSVHVVVGNLEISGIYSDLIKSSFTISKF